MPTALWKDTVIAQATDDEVALVEGNTYFPLDKVHQQYLRDSATHTICSWKGTASYYDVVVNGETNKDAAWFYPTPKDEAKQITGYVAFWRGIKVLP